jgi:hypothetical protein
MPQVDFVEFSFSAAFLYRSIIAKERRCVCPQWLNRERFVCRRTGTAIVSVIDQTSRRPENRRGEREGN